MECPSHKTKTVIAAFVGGFQLVHKTAALPLLLKTDERHVMARPVLFTDVPELTS